MAEESCIYPDIVLASSSPRRRELLAGAGVRFCVLAPQVDETLEAPLPPRDETALLARRKAHAALEMLGGDDAYPIVACDTIVVHRGEVFGKPVDAADASRMLHALSGDAHEVMSGVCILFRGSEVSFVETTEVVFKQLSDEQIARYIADEHPYDKAGSYAIQGPAGAFVDRVGGDYDNVVGLPLAATLQALGKMAAEMEEPRMGKAALRKRMKAVRKGIGPARREEASAEVCRLVMDTPEFASARVVAAFRPFGSELRFDELVARWPAGKTLAVPVTLPERRMEFVAVQPGDILPGASALDFLANPAGITELPEGFEVVDESAIDLMLAPGLAFDAQGFRLGYGGGYYDVYQSRPGFRASVMGAFFAEQRFEGALPREENDISLPAIVTQDGILRF